MADQFNGSTIKKTTLPMLYAIAARPKEVVAAIRDRSAAGFIQECNT